MFFKKDDEENTSNPLINEDLKKEVIAFLKDLTIIIIIVLIVRTFIVLPFQIS
jgi:signal peptidase I